MCVCVCACVCVCVRVCVNIIFLSAVKRLIASKIRFYLHNICMCTVYIYYLNIDTHLCMNIFKKKLLFYIKCIYI